MERSDSPSLILDQLRTECRQVTSIRGNKHIKSYRPLRFYSFSVLFATFDNRGEPSVDQGIFFGF